MTAALNVDKFIAAIRVQPKGGALNSDQLLYISTILQQLDSRVQADGKAAIKIKKDTELYRSLDASLGMLPEWKRVSATHEIEALALVQIIEHSQRGK
jgi:hypothetical protein